MNTHRADVILTARMIGTAYTRAQARANGTHRQPTHRAEATR